MAALSSIYFGLSGFSYKEWQGEGLLYPPTIKQTEFLAHYASRFEAVEMDGSFYRLPTEAAVEKWLRETPDGFRFCFKAHRWATHMHRLKPEAAESISRLLDRLKTMRKAGRLGPILLQLPPNMKRNDERIAEFFRLVPRGDGIDYAIEFRHESWHEDAVETMLRELGVLWVMSDRDALKARRAVTADAAYARLRRSDYGRDDFKDWGRYLAELASRGTTCYVFCKHEDAKNPWEWADAVRAVASAATTRPR